MPEHTDHYAVIGHPIDHSRSPHIHAAFAAQTAQAMTYGRLAAAAEAFPDTARAFFRDGGRGLNVTLPFKQQAATFAHRTSERAQAAGAVNTLARQADDTIIGDNTDGIGLVRALTDHLGLTLADKRILILGAGGAVRGVAAPLLDTRPGHLVIANRTPDKAETIAERFGQAGPVSACALANAAANGPFDVVINAISAGLQGQMPALPGQLFATDAAAYDMIYADEATPFLRWAARQGITRYRDGFGMLVEQAAASFDIWRNQRPQTGVVIEQLRPGTT